MRVTAPTAALVRQASDLAVLDVLLTTGTATRTEIATRTGLSRPTATASVARLQAAALVTDTGERTSGRGRSAGLVSLSGDAEIALVLGVEPTGISGEAVDAGGGTLAGGEMPVGADIAADLVTCATRLREETGRKVGRIVVSVADPVDRHTGAVVALPDEPFLVGHLDPQALLAHLCARVSVDNDVNWAAPMLSDGSFAVLHLGTGLGCAVVEDGSVLRGGRGLAGEIAHVVVAGPGGQAMSFTDVFGCLGLRASPRTTALDVSAVQAALAGDAPTAEVIGGAVAGVIAALVGLCDPERVVLTGPWALEAVDVVQEQVRRARRPVVTRLGAWQLPNMAGARAAAVRLLREDLADRVRQAA